MHMRSTSWAMTFVLLMSVKVFAAPADLETNNDAVVDSDAQKTEIHHKLDALQITQPPKELLQKEEKEYIFPYNQSLSPRYGIVFDQETFSNRQLPDYIIGVNFMLPSDDHIHWEVGADVRSNATGRLNVGYKYVINYKSSLRPYGKVGFSMLATPKDGIASILRLTNYHALIAFGIEDTLTDPLSFRMDIELVAGSEQIAAFLCFGYVWSWK